MDASRYTSAEEERKPRMRTDPDTSWEIVRENPLFEEYYKRQKVVSDEEWDDFIASLQLDLPITFRIVEGTTATNVVTRTVTEFCKSNPDDIRRLGWFPGIAYEISAARHTLRKSERLRNFHRFLVHQSESGTVVRQEAVSMLPVLFIPTESESETVLLDMCAAPGSKSSQLIELVHRNTSSGLMPKAAIIANDASSTRSHMLLHRLRHLDSPTLLVTNHLAQAFPNIFVRTVSSENECSLNGSESEYVKLSFSAILCDVPCSSDGTLRKSKALWKSWTPGRAMGLHRLQLNILRRAIMLCQVGGTVVYSTCSFNPVENEAIVNAALRSFGTDAIEILDVKDRIRGLQSRPGLISWAVLRRGTWFENIETACTNRAGGTREAMRQVAPSMFPQYRSVEDPAVYRYGDGQLKRTLRLLPHLNNTGGFFIAVIRKTAPTSWKPGWDPRPSSSPVVMSKKCRTAAAVAVANDFAPPSIVAPLTCASETRIEGPTCTSKPQAPSQLGQSAAVALSDIDETASIVDSAEAEEDMVQSMPDDGAPEDIKIPPMAVTFPCLKPQVDVLSFAELDRTGFENSPLKTGQKSSINVPNPCGGGATALWHNVANCYGLPHMLPESVASKLVVRRKRIVNEDNDKDAALMPRKVWLVSEGVSRIIHGLFRTPLKIISAGCLVFSAQRPSQFRITMSGARWLGSVLLGISLPQLTGPHVAVVDWDCFAKILRTADPHEKYNALPLLEGSLQSTNESCYPRYPRDSQLFRDEPANGKEPGLLDSLLQNFGVPLAADGEALFKNVNFRHHLATLPVSRESLEALNLLPLENPCLVVAGRKSESPVAVPAWRGKANIELLVDVGTRYSLLQQARLALESEKSH